MVGNMSKKVGVIIPSYNQGRFIEDAIKSVLANKKHIDIKIAVIDGDSADETISILEKYRTDLTFWCSEPDHGQADAINKGIRMLDDCDYFLWLNSDDVYESEYSIKTIVEFAEEHNKEVCYGLSHFIDEKGQIIGEYPVEKFHYKTLGNRCFISQPSVMFSKKAYETVGPINENLTMCLDYEYWIRLAQKFEFGFVEQYIGATRMYGETKTSTMQQRHLKEAMAILMKYYGKVPMHWVVTKVLADWPDNIWQFLPKRVLMLVLLPLRKVIVKKSIEGVKNV